MVLLRFDKLALISKYYKTMKNLNAFSSKFYFFALIIFKTISQNINIYISPILVIINLKIISTKFLNSLTLLRTWTLVIYKLIKIIIIDEEKNLKFRNFSIVTTYFKGFNYGLNFLIISFIPSLHLNYFPKKKDYEVPLTRF